MQGDHPSGASRRRLAGFDYSRAGIYFVTIATSYHSLMLGTIVDGEMHLSNAGSVVDAVWISLPDRFRGLDLDVFVVMPNHIHGLLVLPDQIQRPEPFHLSDVVRTFKAASTRQIRTSSLPSFSWQPNYHEHVVRTDRDLQRIREYIVNNPLRWSLDRANPGGSRNTSP